MEIYMPRFYFRLASKDSHITDDNGKEFDTLHDAYAHARKLIDKITFHLGHDGEKEWNVIVLNNQHDAQMIIPFSVSHSFRAPGGATSERGDMSDMLPGWKSVRTLK